MDRQLTRNHLESELKELRSKRDKLWKWLMDENNMDRDNWREVKETYNAVTVKIDNRIKRIEHLGSGSNPDYSKIIQTPYV